MSNALIVFIKNPVLGKVKTRLAKTIGDKKSLKIYQALLWHTRTISENVNAECFVFYSDFVDREDDWQLFRKRLQIGNNLGGKMSNAFAEVFACGNNIAVIIGSDCIEITTAIIQEAFTVLQNQDIVIGPAADGGYYLLGMKQLHPELFKNKNWSTPDVLQQTIADLNDLQLSYFLLPVLRDVDEAEDLAGTNLL